MDELLERFLDSLRYISAFSCCSEDGALLLTGKYRLAPDTRQVPPDLRASPARLRPCRKSSLMLHPDGSSTPALSFTDKYLPRPVG